MTAQEPLTANAAEPAPESWRPVTARPVGDGDGHDELREALAEALPRWIFSGWREEVADALLPVVTAWVERRARERAAEELRAAARDLEQTPNSSMWLGDVADYLAERADALAADDRAGQR